MRSNASAKILVLCFVLLSMSLFLCACNDDEGASTMRIRNAGQLASYIKDGFVSLSAYIDLDAAGISETMDKAGYENCGDGFAKMYSNGDEAAVVLSAFREMNADGTGDEAILTDDAFIQRGTIGQSEKPTMISATFIGNSIEELKNDSSIHFQWLAYTDMEPNPNQFMFSCIDCDGNELFVTGDVNLGGTMMAGIYNKGYVEANGGLYAPYLDKSDTIDGFLVLAEASEDWVVEKFA